MKQTVQGEIHSSFFYKMCKCKWLEKMASGESDGDIVKVLRRPKDLKGTGYTNIYIVKNIKEKGITSYIDIIDIKDIIDSDLKKSYSNLLSQGVNVDPIDLGYVIQTESGLYNIIKNENDLNIIFKYINHNIVNHIKSLIENRCDKRYFAFSVEQNTKACLKNNWDYQIDYHSFDDLHSLYKYYSKGYMIIDVESVGLKKDIVEE